MPARERGTCRGYDIQEGRARPVEHIFADPGSSLRAYEGNPERHEHPCLPLRPQKRRGGDHHPGDCWAGPERGDPDKHPDEPGRPVGGEEGIHAFIKSNQAFCFPEVLDQATEECDSVKGGKTH